jgi:hypothetical protein
MVCLALVFRHSTTSHKLRRASNECASRKKLRNASRGSIANLRAIPGIPLESCRRGQEP